MEKNIMEINGSDSNLNNINCVVENNNNTLTLSNVSVKILKTTFPETSSSQSAQSDVCPRNKCEISFQFLQENPSFTIFYEDPATNERIELEKISIYGKEISVNRRHDIAGMDFSIIDYLEESTNMHPKYKFSSVSMIFQNKQDYYAALDYFNDNWKVITQKTINRQIGQDHNELRISKAIVRQESHYNSTTTETTSLNCVLVFELFGQDPKLMVLFPRSETSPFVSTELEMPCLTQKVSANFTADLVELELKFQEPQYSTYLRNEYNRMMITFEDKPDFDAVLKYFNKHWTQELTVKPASPLIEDKMFVYIPNFDQTTKLQKTDFASLSEQIQNIQKERAKSAITNVLSGIQKTLWRWELNIETM